MMIDSIDSKNAVKYFNILSTIWGDWYQTILTDEEKGKSSTFVIYLHHLCMSIQRIRDWVHTELKDLDSESIDSGYISGFLPSDFFGKLGADTGSVTNDVITEFKEILYNLDIKKYIKGIKKGLGRSNINEKDVIDELKRKFIDIREKEATKSGDEIDRDNILRKILEIVLSNEYALDDEILDFIIRNYHEGSFDLDKYIELYSKLYHGSKKPPKISPRSVTFTTRRKTRRNQQRKTRRTSQK